jgi:hypothetical protein
VQCHGSASTFMLRGNVQSDVFGRGASGSSLSLCPLFPSIVLRVFLCSLTAVVCTEIFYGFRPFSYSNKTVLRTNEVEITTELLVYRALSEFEM